MDSKWTMNEDMDLNTHGDDLEPWKTQSRYNRRKGWDGRTLGSANTQNAGSIQCQYKFRGER